MARAGFKRDGCGWVVVKRVRIDEAVRGGKGVHLREGDNLFW